jgi:hypothetical protein
MRILTAALEVASGEDDGNGPVPPSADEIGRFTMTALGARGLPVALSPGNGGNNNNPLQTAGAANNASTNPSGANGINHVVANMALGGGRTAALVPSVQQYTSWDALRAAWLALVLQVVAPSPPATSGFTLKPPYARGFHQVLHPFIDSLDRWAIAGAGAPAGGSSGSTDGTAAGAWTAPLTTATILPAAAATDAELIAALPASPRAVLRLLRARSYYLGSAPPAAGSAGSSGHRGAAHGPGAGGSGAQHGAAAPYGLTPAEMAISRGRLTTAAALMLIEEAIVTVFALA